MVEGRTPKRDRGSRGPFRSGCPLASTLDVVGDRWSLLVLRGLMAGNTRYGDFLRDPERIATNILACRLAHLERAGLVERKHDGEEPRPGRYRLTRKGANLLPAMQALAEWGRTHLPDRWDSPAWFRAARPSDFYPGKANGRGVRRG